MTRSADSNKEPDLIQFAYKQMNRILEAVDEQKDIEQVLKIAISSIIQITAAERGFFLLGGIQVAQHFDGSDISSDYKISKSLAKQVMENNESILVDSAKTDQRLQAAASIQKYPAKSILCTPIRLGKEQVAGVIYLDNRLVENCFQQTHLEYVKVFARQIAIVVHNYQLVQNLQKKQQEVHQLNLKLRKKTKMQTAELDFFREKMQTSGGFFHLRGKSRAILKIYQIIDKIKDRDLSVLIQGESGTGKELIARAIHDASSRQSYPFVCENCAAVPESLFESEFFGHIKGAFTGANTKKEGLFVQANKGTILLDEIGELNLELQKKLLRVLQESQVRPVGSQEKIPINVRVIAATNKNLAQMVAENKFREDLYYRLNGMKVITPPLRERKEDIPLLVQHFLEEFALKDQEEPKQIERSLISTLIDYSWPGNVRQLRNEIQRLHSLSPKNYLDACYLSEEILPSLTPSTQSLPTLLREVEKQEILKALQICSNNKSKASQN